MPWVVIRTPRRRRPFRSWREANRQRIRGWRLVGMMILALLVFWFLVARYFAGAP